jgi:hypothetical protein
MMAVFVHVVHVLDEICRCMHGLISGQIKTCVYDK